MLDPKLSHLDGAFSPRSLRAFGSRIVRAYCPQTVSQAGTEDHRVMWEPPTANDVMPHVMRGRAQSQIASIDVDIGVDVDVDTDQGAWSSQEEP